MNAKNSMIAVDFVGACTGEDGARLRYPALIVRGNLISCQLGAILFRAPTDPRARAVDWSLTRVYGPSCDGAQPAAGWAPSRRRRTYLPPHSGRRFARMIAPGEYLSRDTEALQIAAHCRAWAKKGVRAAGKAVFPVEEIAAQVLRSPGRQADRLLRTMHDLVGASAE